MMIIIATVIIMINILYDYGYSSASIMIVVVSLFCGRRPGLRDVGSELSGSGSL